jgi:hypothetical protein
MPQANETGSRHTKNKTGRSEKKKTINCLLHEWQYKQIIQHAAKSGKKPTTYFRDAAMAYMAQKYVVPEDVNTSLKATIFQIRKIATNLNQIAKRTNTLQKLTLFDALKAKHAMLDLEDTIKSFIRNPSQRG